MRATAVSTTATPAAEAGVPCGTALRDASTTCVDAVALSGIGFARGEQRRQACAAYTRACVGVPASKNAARRPRT